MSKTKVIGVAGILIVAGIISLFIYGNEEKVTGAATYKQSIKIGAILPLSGSAAYYGENSQKGIEIAKEELKQIYPDYRFEVLYEDSQYTAKGGVDAYNKLKNFDRLDAVITGASQVSLAVLPLAKESGILQMAIFSSANKYSVADDLTFRISTRNEIESEAVANFISLKNYRKLAILYINNDFGVGFKDALKEQITKKNIPISIVVEENYLLDTNDFRTILTKAKQKILMLFLL